MSLYGVLKVHYPSLGIEWSPLAVLIYTHNHDHKIQHCSHSGRIIINYGTFSSYNLQHKAKVILRLVHFYGVQMRSYKWDRKEKNRYSNTIYKQKMTQTKHLLEILHTAEKYIVIKLYYIAWINEI